MMPRAFLFLWKKKKIITLFFFFPLQDSLCIAVKTSRLVEELACLQSYLDTSSLPPDHLLHDKSRARRPGLLKLEYGNMVISRFAGVRSKCYVLQLESQGKQSAVYKCKGVPNKAVSSAAEFQDYKACVFDSVQKDIEFSSIRTDGQHRVYTMRQKRTALKNWDNKRWLADDGITTKAFSPGRAWDATLGASDVTLLQSGLETLQELAGDREPVDAGGLGEGEEEVDDSLWPTADFCAEDLDVMDALELSALM